MYAYGEGTCPRAMAASDRLITLPIHLRLTEADLGRVTEAVKSFVR